MSPSPARIGEELIDFKPAGQLENDRSVKPGLRQSAVDTIPIDGPGSRWLVIVAAAVIIMGVDHAQVTR